VPIAVQFQSRSAPCWMTSLSALTWIVRLGNSRPSSSMIGRAGWVAVL
jgi:hypothetical protein